MPGRQTIASEHVDNYTLISSHTATQVNYYDYIQSDLLSVNIISLSSNLHMLHDKERVTDDMSLRSYYDSDAMVHHSEAMVHHSEAMVHHSDAMVHHSEAMVHHSGDTHGLSLSA